MHSEILEKIRGLEELHSKMPLKSKVVSKLSSKYLVHRDQVARLIGVLGDEREVAELLSVGEGSLMRSIRVNTLKTTKQELKEVLIAKGLELSDHPYVDYGLIVHRSPITLAALHEHLMGLFYIQGPASMLPVLALNMPSLDVVLDACCGAGGKTTQMAQHNPNALIVSVDVSPRKLLALKNNLSRLGVYNVVSVKMDARLVYTLGSFPGILLDAPCSGDGLLPYSSRRKLRDNKDVLGRVRLQLELLDSVARALSPGGELVYSTCSTNFEENEFVVSTVSEARNLEIVETGLKAGDEGVDEYYGLKVNKRVRLCRRFYPHRHLTEGFTICKMVRRA